MGTSGSTKGSGSNAALVPRFLDNAGDGPLPGSDQSAHKTVVTAAVARGRAPTIPHYRMMYVPRSNALMRLGTG
jgi:hypothetical protein